MTDAGRVGRGARVNAVTPRRVVLARLSSRPWPSGVRIIAMSDRTPSSVGANGGARQRCFAFQLESDVDGERRGGREVVDDDADMVDPLDPHACRVVTPGVGVAEAVSVRARLRPIRRLSRNVYPSVAW